MAAQRQSTTCPYLDTIDRASLDFDFEKLCSVSLTNLRVYGCLVCGKYFHGRAQGSPAYQHSLSVGHHVFVNLETGKVYCLPDLYEVLDPSLNDIKTNLNPQYTPEQLERLAKENRKSRGLDGQEYVSGYVGLNNLGQTDYFNVVVQSFAHIPELMKHYMLLPPHEHVPHLTSRFGELLRKLWNPRAFKGQVSPHELAQAVSVRSENKFQLNKRSDPLDLLAWILHALHDDDVKLRGLTPKQPSIIHSTFQGRVHITSQRFTVRDTEGGKEEEKLGEETKREVPFLYLQFDLPQTPLFKEESEKNIIPQVPLFALLHKYNGMQETLRTVPGQRNVIERSKYIVTKFPKYLICTYKRFSTNFWFKEKNNCIVNFPVKSLELRDFCIPAIQEKYGSVKYDLIANVCHDGSVDEGAFFANILNRATGEWYTYRDLEIKQGMPQEISCSAPCIQIWAAQDPSVAEFEGNTAKPKKRKAEQAQGEGSAAKKQATESAATKIEKAQ